MQARFQLLDQTRLLSAGVLTAASLKAGKAF